MVALLALSLAAAFPVRGSVWQAADTAFRLGANSLGILKISYVSGCGSTTYSLDTPHNQGLLDSFPSAARLSTPFLFWTPGYPKAGSGPCTGEKGELIFSPTASKFIFRDTSNGAIWMDSARSDPPFFSVKPEVRWRWSRLEGTPAWARWTDTVRLGTSGSFQGGVPLLSLLRESAIDSVVPAQGNQPRPAIGQNLTLRRDTSDALGTLTWSSVRGTADLQRTRSWSTVPMGSTLYVAAAGTDSVGTRLWRIWSDGAVQDSFWIERPSPASVKFRRSKQNRSGASWNIDGRKSSGKHSWNPRFGASENGKLLDSPPSR